MEKHGVIDLMGQTLTVEYDYYSASKGRTEKGSGGLPLEPDEPESVEINLVMIGGMEVTELLLCRKDEIQEAILEQLNPGEEDGGY